MQLTAQPFNSRQWMIGKELEAFAYSDSQPIMVSSHSHDFYELYLFIDARGGNVQYNVGDVRMTLVPGDIICIPPHVEHHPTFSPYPTAYRRIVIWFTKETLSAFNSPEFFQLFQSPATPYRFPPTVSSYLIEAAMSIAWESTSRDRFSELLARANLQRLLALIGRYHEIQVEECSSQPGESLINAVLIYINDHLSDELSLDFLADHFFVSKFYLSHIFKDYLGVGIHSYIRQRRILWAKTLLTSGYSATEIYRRCGFNDYSSFYRAFVSYYGVPPKNAIVDSKEAPPDVRSITPN